MAYSFQGRIDASDYNGFISQVNEVIADTNSGGTGLANGGYGYGQSSLTGVAIGNTVTAAQWNSLLGAIDDCATHQGTSISLPASVNVGADVIALNGVARPSASTPDDIQAAINTIRANRFNVDASQSTASSTTTVSQGGNWDGTRTQTITATFASWNQMRYFFNAGGTIRFSFSFTGTPNNTTEDNWIAMAAAVGLISFRPGGTTSSGGVGGTGNGFYDLTSSNLQVFSYVPPGYSSEQYRIQARLNTTAGSATQIIFTLSFVTPSGGNVIDLTLNSELSLLENDTGVITTVSPTINAGSIS